MSRDIEDLREKLLRELGEMDLSPATTAPNHDFDYLMKLDDSEFSKIGLDFAVALSIQGQWTQARNAVKRYRALEPANISALVFEMRCLYELESFTEVLALGQSPLSEKHHLITANYLMALSFEALQMFPQARSRYEAVIRQDSSFLDASLRLSKLQGFSGR